MSLTCQEARQRLPLREEQPAVDLETHLQECHLCTRAAQSHQQLDRALQALLVSRAPSDLTARLLALVPAMSAGMPVRGKHWGMQRKLVIGAALVLTTLSIVLLALAFGWILQLTGADQLFTTISSWPGALADKLYSWQPDARYLVEGLGQLREPLQLAIVAALLWRALDRLRTPSETTAG